MPTAFDEDMVARVRALSAVASLCTNKQVYHEEVLAADPSLANFPCLVYRVIDGSPEMELGGNTSGFSNATFEFDCYSRKSSDTRALAAALVTLTGSIASPNPIVWIEANDTSDSFDPLDFQEKGLKSAQVTINVVYEG